MVRASFTLSKLPWADFECKLEAIFCRVALLDHTEVGSISQPVFLCRDRAGALVQIGELSMSLIICVRYLVNVIESEYHSHVYKGKKKKR